MKLPLKDIQLNIANIANRSEYDENIIYELLAAYGRSKSSITQLKNGTIRSWIRNDKGIPAQKIGKQWKFKCSELDEWIKSGKSAIE